jgi:hypothetical protein
MDVRVTLAAVGALVSVALMAAPSWGATAVTSCTGALGPGTINGDVSAGAGCHLEPGTTVTGSVTVNPGGSLTTEVHYAPTVRINGDVTSKGATTILLEHVLIGGDVDVQGTTEFTQMVHGRVNGNVNIQKSSGVDVGLEFITVEGNVVMEYNDALLVITEAKIGKNVVVEHDTTATLPIRLFNIVEVTYSEIEGQVGLNNNSVSAGGFITGVIAFGDHVRKSLEVSNNTAASPGAVSVGGNAVAGTLTCESNEPPPEDVRKPNTAKKKLGQCELL